MSKHETALSVVTTAELEDLVGNRERMALHQHQVSTELALSNIWLKFHLDKDSIKHSYIDNDADVHGIPDTLEERLEYLQTEVVKSALLGFWLHDSEFKDAKRFRDERVVPMLSKRLDSKWNVKMRTDHSNGTNMRIFIAKSALGVFHPNHGNDSAVVERRTFAAFGTDGSSPRASDMNHALGISERHPNDGRTIVIAPTSTSFYAFKPESSEKL